MYLYGPSDKTSLVYNVQCIQMRNMLFIPFYPNVPVITSLLALVTVQLHIVCLALISICHAKCDSPHTYVWKNKTTILSYYAVCM